MVKIPFFFLLVLASASSTGQNYTDCSLFLKSDSSNYLDRISSKSGDLFDELGHHGPAIENEYMALRMYFDHKAAIDVYSKQHPGLELKVTKWYPSEVEQKKGLGADYYKAGETVGLGGVRLWDGMKVVSLNPVGRRSVRVGKEANFSFMEMLSEGVPYKGSEVDVLVRVSVFSGIREAKVEAFALSADNVQFVTGINYHPGNQVEMTDRFILTWGFHPEDVAAEKVRLGGAILFNSEDFEMGRDDGKQHLLISKPTKQLTHWITSANQREEKINDFTAFMSCVRDFSGEQNKQYEFKK